MIHNNRTLNVPCKGLTCTVEDDADRCCRYDTVRYDTCAANIYSSDGRLCQIVTAYDTKKRHTTLKHFLDAIDLTTRLTLGDGPAKN